MLCGLMLPSLLADLSDMTSPFITATVLLPDDPNPIELTNELFLNIPSEGSLSPQCWPTLATETVTVPPPATVNAVKMVSPPTPHAPNSLRVYGEADVPAPAHPFVLIPPVILMPPLAGVPVAA
jgi:hypothetical protein